MACIPLPSIDLPQLPSPLSIAPPALPAISVSLDLCCKQPTLSVKVPLPLGAAVINPAVIALINKNLALVDAYIDALPLDCPRE